MFDSSHFHPMIVHFPIALIMVGFIADLFSLFLSKKEPSLSKIGFYLMILGTLGAIAAFLTGEFFTTKKIGEAGLVLAQHEMFAKITMGIMIFASIFRIYLVIAKKENSALKYFVILLIAIAAATVSYTGFLGGNLVYNFMIGL
ncbi:MAG: DUF2231 domain-containing protein [Bacteroidetes bacterium]|nr:DUF2231 domain-containing protein [Bacteroidota bacterium]